MKFIEVFNLSPPKKIARIHSVQSMTLLFGLIFFLSFPIFSQPESKLNVKKSKEQNSKTSPEKELKEQEKQNNLLNVSEQLTTSLLDDAKKSESTKRSLILADLAKLWWKNNNARSREWLKIATDGVLYKPITESKEDKEERQKTARKLLKTVILLDSKLAEKIVDELFKDSETSGFSQQNADEILKAALQIVEQNPSLAKSLGSTSLKTGQSYLISRLIGELNLKNPNLSEELFGEAIFTASNLSNSQTEQGFVSTLSFIAFNQYKGKTLSETSRKKFLEMLFNLIYERSSANAQNTGNCSLIPLAANLISSFETFFPEKAVLVRQYAAECRKIPSSNSTLTESSLKESKPVTADDFLRLAKDSKDKLQKAVYFNRAIEKLYQAKEFVEIIAVLEDMTEDDREAFGKEAWKSWRWESATQAALAFTKKNDISSASQIIEKTPKSIRPFVQIGVASEVKDDAQFAVNIITTARKDLESLEIEPKDRAGLFLSLLKIYAVVLPNDAVSLLKETIKAINKADAANRDKKPQNDFAPLMETISLPPVLFEIDQVTTLNLVSEVEDLNNRVRIRLGCLESTLKKLTGR